MIMMNRKFEPVSSLLLLLLDNNPSSHNKATPNGTKMGEIRAAIKEGALKAEQAPDVGFHPLWNHPKMTSARAPGLKGEGVSPEAYDSTLLMNTTCG